MDEKDRLGQLLDKKERAEENRFFAERDRELIEQLRRKRPRKKRNSFANSSTCAVRGAGHGSGSERSTRSRLTNVRSARASGWIRVSWKHSPNTGAASGSGSSCSAWPVCCRIPPDSPSRLAGGGGVCVCCGHAGLIGSFAALLYYGREVCQMAPPVPERIISADADRSLLFSGDDIRVGQDVWRSIGGHDLGSARSGCPTIGAGRSHT